MFPSFPLVPRYRLDDELPWLEGIDPSRHYWLAVNGWQASTIAIPGLSVASLADLKSWMKKFRGLQPGEQMTLNRASSSCSLYCISPNCYALEVPVNGSLAWHLFDQESLESLLMTAHPDWQCSDRDLELGRRWLSLSWERPAAA